MKDLTLLILAGGMGARFGGLKQATPFGPNGEFIIDYSIYDAIEAGFSKVVFLIKEENFDLFKTTIGSRVEGKIPVGYAFQKLTDIPAGYKMPADRQRPLGTAHAVYACRNNIDGPFAIINADDFYGRDAFMKMAHYLRNLPVSSKEEYAMVGYLAFNTLTENGSVRRGVCEIKDGYLEKVVESSVEKRGGDIIAKPLNGGDEFVVPEDGLVSMNMFGFTPSIFEYIEKEFPKFLDRNKDNLDTCEFFIPDIAEQGIKDGFSNMRVLDTTAKWYGITYKEDKDNVINSINKLIEDGVYPHTLWGK